jgi:hypothetical protein
MLTTFSMLAYASILMFAVVERSTPNVMRQSPDLKAVRLKPCRVIASHGSK